jgi:hypothetical protein
MRSPAANPGFSAVVVLSREVEQDVVRGSRDPLPLTPRRSRPTAGRLFAVLAKRGDPAKSLFEQHARMAFSLFGGLSNLACNVRQARQHVIPSGGKATVHFPSERPDFGVDFLPKLALNVCKANLHLAAHGRKFNAHVSSELRNLYLYNRHPLAERGHILSQAGDFRRQCVEPFHGLLQAFYAIRQQFIRHHSSVSTRRSTSTRAFDGRTNARCVPTTLPSSDPADNGVRTRTGTGRWRHVDVMPALEGA